MDAEHECIAGDDSRRSLITVANTVANNRPDSFEDYFKMKGKVVPESKKSIEWSTTIKTNDTKSMKFWNARSFHEFLDLSRETDAKCQARNYSKEINKALTFSSKWP